MKKSFKTIVSVILSLTFIFSYLNLMTSEVSADMGSRIEVGSVFVCPEDNYSYEFRPDSTGYYFLEASGWGIVSEIKGDDEKEINISSVIPLELPQMIEDPYQDVYYLEYGKIYSFQFNRGDEFVLRKVQKYVELGINNQEVFATLDKPFTLTVTPVLSPDLQLDGDISYSWCEIPNSIEYTTPSVTLNLSQLLDENNHFISGSDYCEYNSDFGIGFVSCYVSVEYNGKNYGNYVNFNIIGNRTEFSSQCEVYEENDSYEWGLPYSFDEDTELFNLKDSKPEGVTATYQWYKYDAERAASGNFTNESDLYIKMAGQTSNCFKFNQSARNILGEPVFDMSGNQCSVYHKLICIITFAKNGVSFTRKLEFQLSYNLGYSVYAEHCVDTPYYAGIVLPKEAKYIDNDTVIDGYFKEDDLPEGYSYRYNWYNCRSIPNQMSNMWIACGADVDIGSELGDIDYLGTGKEFMVDPRSVSLKYQDGEYYGYVVCIIEPMYNGERCNNNTFNVGYYVFALHYGTFRIANQTLALHVLPGYSGYISCEAEGLYPSYQWQKLINGEWEDLKYFEARTKKIQAGCNFDTAGQQYRCKVTDMLGNVIYSNPIVIDIMYGPVIYEQPVDYEGYTGDTAKFTLAASGVDLTYQWQLKKGNKWADLNSGGANTPELSVKVDDSKNGKIYRCKVTASNGNIEYTNEVKIIVKTPKITISSQPKSYSGPVGSTAKFSVAAEGEGLTYQWQLKKGSKWADLTSGGATTSTLSIKVDSSKNGKIYRCLITNADGEDLATGEVSITVKEPDITIVTQPKSYVGTEGNSAKFSVVAEGEGLTYQWQLKKGSKWADLTSGGATTATMSIKVDASKDGKVYRCVIKNAAGEELATNEVSITIKEPDITIVTQPVSYTGHVGTKAKFAVEAEGEGLTYQWQLKKGSTWADLTSGGATTTELTVKVDQSKQGKIYRCVITNAAGEQLASDEVSINVLGENDLPPVSPTAGVAEEDGPIVSNDPPEVIVPADNESAEPAQAEEPVQSPAPVEASEPAETFEPVESVAPVENVDSID